MKDRSGNELIIGDTVAYVTNFSGYALPAIGKVTKINEAYIDIEQTSPTWDFVAIPNTTSRLGKNVIKVI